MTGFEWAMLISAIIGTGSALTSGVDVDEETPAQPTGGQDFDPSELIKQLSSQQGPLGSVADLPTLAGPTEAATTAATKTPQTKVTPPPPVPGPPGGEAVAKAATPKLTGPTAPIPPPQAPPDVGQVLAAIPDALQAIAPLLGLTDQRVGGTTAAPVAGGAPGGLVGRFAQQGAGIDIGQLLAALPGIRG
jgi:hypothetical protein